MVPALDGIIVNVTGVDIGIYVVHLYEGGGYVLCFVL